MKKGAIELAQEWIDLLREERQVYLDKLDIDAAKEADRMARGMEDSLERILANRAEACDWDRLRGAVVSMRYAG